MRRKLMACVLAAMLLLTSCQGAEPNSAGEKAPETENAEKPEITVYCQDGIALFLQAIREYRQLYDAEVKLELFEDSAEMEMRITTEALSGGGPDVFLFSSERSALDVHKMMKNGSFYGLNDLMEQEKSYRGYQEENYYDCMLRAGAYQGEQYILPFSFNMIQFYSDSRLTDYVELQDSCTMQELLQAIESECLRLSGEKECTGIIWDIRRRDTLNMLLEQSQLPYIDYDSNQLMLQKEEMEELAEFWRRFLETEKINEVIQKYSGNYYSAISFYADSTSMLNAVRHNVSSYAQAEIEPDVYILPAWEQADSYTAAICEYGAVNANSAHLEEAYRLLRFMMDYPVSYDFNKYQLQISYYLPVHKRNLHACLQLVRQQRGKGNFTILPLQAEYEAYGEQLETVLGQIDAAVIPNAKVGSIIEDVMQPYLRGEEDFDACYTKLENRLRLYLSE